MVVRSLFFLIPYFPYNVYDTYSKGSQEGIYFPFSKNCLFNLGVCFFPRIWRISTFNFCVVFGFSEIYLPFSFFFCFFNCFVFFQIFKKLASFFLRFFRFYFLFYCVFLSFLEFLKIVFLIEFCFCSFSRNSLVFLVFCFQDLKKTILFFGLFVGFSELHLFRFFRFFCCVFYTVLLGVLCFF